MMNPTKSKLLVASLFVSMLGVSLPANAQSAEQWRTRIQEEYNLSSTETPITEELNGSQNLEAWQSRILQEYNIASSETPITDELNGLRNLEEWRARIEQDYSIANSATPVTDEFGFTRRSN
jgi:hypothetical protein